MSTLTVGNYTPKVKTMMMKEAPLSEPGPASPACTVQMTCEHYKHTNTHTHIYLYMFELLTYLRFNKHGF